MFWAGYHEQFITAFIFAVGVAIVLALGVWVLGVALYRKLTRKPAPKRFRWVRRMVLVLAAVGLVCIAYGYFIEPNWLEVTHVRLPMAKLAPGAEPIRIVHISDLHCGVKARLEEKLPRIIADLKPDLIAFTGDAANSEIGLERFHRCMTRLSAIAPTFAVQGNWDLGRGLGRDFADTGGTELVGQVVRKNLRGTEVYLVGAINDRWDKVEQALATVPPSALCIVLYHYPDEIYRASAAGVDLYLAGHTHGGQVTIPFYGALITLSAYGKRFEGGLYPVGKTYLYVNRGIGMEGGHVPRVRFCARPEVTVIELVPPSR